MMTAELQFVPGQGNPSGARLFRAAICEEVRRAALDYFGDSLRAVVLTGSLARDEASFFAQEGDWALAGDADVMLVFHERAALPPAAKVKSLGRRIENALEGSGLDCHLSLSALHPVYLRRLSPAIFAYELRACGEVIWGDAGVLNLIPVFSAAAIPLEDAWRLLGNRMIEQLEAAADFGQDDGALAALYAAAKLYLDMATSLLVFLGHYEPSYRARAGKLVRLAAGELNAGDCPFPLEEFAARVAACTAWKLSPNGGEATARAAAFAQHAAADAQRLWRWELACLTSAPATLPEGELLERWMARQPLQGRLRGWLYAVRDRGWHRSFPHWRRWARLAVRSSPRYCVYAAAARVFFALPSDGRQGGGSEDWEAARCWLPVLRHAGGESRRDGWRHCAAEIAWNYHTFLEGTRA